MIRVNKDRPAAAAAAIASAKPSPAKGASVYQLTNDQVFAALGKTKLAGQTNLFHVRLAEVPKSATKAFPAATAAIAQQQAGGPDEAISLTVNTMKRVSAPEAIALLSKASENNDQTYSHSEIRPLLRYLEAVSAPGAQIYAARWDDISSEYIGFMLAVHKPGSKELTFAQCTTLLP